MAAHFRDVCKTSGSIRRRPRAYRTQAWLAVAPTGVHYQPQVSCNSDQRHQNTKKKSGRPHSTLKRPINNTHTSTYTRTDAQMHRYTDVPYTDAQADAQIDNGPNNERPKTSNATRRSRARSRARNETNRNETKHSTNQKQKKEEKKTHTHTQERPTNSNQNKTKPNETHLGVVRGIPPAALRLELEVARRHPEEHLLRVGLEERVLAAQEDVGEAPEAPHVHRLRASYFDENITHGYDVCSESGTPADGERSKTRRGNELCVRGGGGG